MRNHKTFLLLILFFLGFTVKAQITGESNVVQGQSYTYHFYDDQRHAGGHWEAVNGDITALGTSYQSGVYHSSVSVQWTTSGTGNIRFIGDNTVLDELDVTIAPGVYAGPDLRRCAGGTNVDLRTLPPDYNAGTWSGPNNTIINGVIQVVTMSAGKYTYTYTASSGGSDSFVLTIDASPAVTISISPNTTQFTEGQTLTFTASGASTYSWSGNGLQSTVGTTVTALASTGVHTYSVVGTATTTTGCTGSASQTITVNPDAGTDVTVCSSSDNIYLGNRPPALTTGTWTCSTCPSGTITSNYINISALSPGSYTFTFTHTTGLSDSFILTVQQSIAGTIDISSDNDCTTVSGSLTLQNGSYLGEIKHWRKSIDNGISWSDPFSAGSASISFSEIQKTVYEVTVQNGSCAVATTSATVEPSGPVAGYLSVSSFQRSCGLASGTLRLDNAVGTSYEWQKYEPHIAGSTWTAFSVTGNSYPFEVTNETWYRVNVFKNNCSPATTSTHKIIISTQGGNTYASNGDQCGTASGNLYLYNYVGSIVKWEKSKDEITWEELPNSAGKSPMPFQNITETTKYRAVVQLPNCSIENSTITTVTVTPPTIPGVVRLKSETHSYVNNTLTFHPVFELSGYNGTIQNWYKYESPDNPQYYSADTETISPVITQTTGFRANVKKDVCPPLLSGQAIFVVNNKFLGIKQLVLGTELSEYQGYSYQVKTVDGIQLKDGFTFIANSAQDFFVLLDDNYSLPPSDQNYVLEETILQEGLKDEDDIYFANAYQRQSTYTYVDGLGRTMQQVQRRANPEENDIVTPVTYDAFGRVDKEYLPYISATTDGHFKTEAVTAQADFYSATSQNITEKRALSSHPYAVKVYEPSPLNRVLEQGAPGIEWQPSIGRTIKFDYQINTENDNVKLWNISASGLPISASYYNAGELYVNVTEDEHGSKVKEYKDKQGLVVLKRTQQNTTWLETYYIHDDFNLLRYVIQPEGVAKLTGNPDQAFLDTWAFQYRYDHRKRAVETKVPGAGWVYHVYDNRDRLVLTQDASQRSKNQWTFTKYDALNRPIVSGIYTYVNQQEPAKIHSREEINAMVSTNAFVEDYSSSEPFGYTTTHVFPKDHLQIMSVTYYDNYNFISDLFGNSFAYDKAALGGLPDQPFNAVRGLVTGTQTLVLGTNTFLKTANWYDKHYQVIQTLSANHLGGTDRISQRYDFTGKILERSTIHSKGGSENITINEEFTYDHAGRPLAHYHQTGNGPKMTLKQQHYNALGQLVDKKLYQKPDGNFQQSVDYRYNIRGWMTSINNASLTHDGGITNDEGNDLFGMELAYNTTVAGINNTPQYNGNISAIRWSNNHGFDPGLKERAYKYDYDPMGRLTAAAHYEKTTGWNMSGGLHEDNISYNMNTSILSIRRKGADGSQMDNLAFTYTGNQLQSVTDSWDTQKGFKDGNTVGADYTYDANGNRITDKNKGITTYKYNYMNQREKVTFSNGSYLLYTYDAAGNKLSQGVYNSSDVLQKKTDYAGEFFYENDTLKYISHEEGRYNVLAGAYEYELRDHLGSNRVTFTTKEEQDEATGTMETENLAAEQSKFLRYENARRISSHLFDKTNGSAPSTTPGYAVRLNGSANEKYGLAKSFAVMPGDVVKAEVYIKYVDTNSNNWTSGLTNLITAIASGTAPAGTVVDGTNYSTSTSSFSLAGLLDTSGSQGQGPKAYLNWLVFDQNFTVINGGFVRMSDAAREYGQDCAHEKLSAEIPITTAGFVYVYLSNENETPVEVYYDQFAVSLKKSPVINATDLYPYGAVALSYTREFSLKQDRLLNGKETQDELGYNVVDLGQRDIDPFVPVFPTIDRAAEKYISLSPYQYLAGNPVSYFDVNGDSLMLFKNGTYVGMHDDGKEEITGFNQQSTADEDGNETFTGAQRFGFNDIELDKAGLKSGKITLNFMSREDVDKTINDSGIGNQSVFSRWSYAATESNATSDRGSGKMDFLGSAPNGQLTIINGVGYNEYDAGNYLWGYAMGKMGYLSLTARTAAHVNAWWSAKTSNHELRSTNPNPVMRWFENRSWGGDSAADQRAIQNGLNDSGSYWKAKWKSIKKMWE